MQIAITVLSQTAGHGDGWLPSGISTMLQSPYPGMPPGLVDGPEEMRKRVREIIRAGANVIKVLHLRRRAVAGRQPAARAFPAGRAGRADGRGRVPPACR